MGSYRNIRNDILKKWLDFREEDIASLSCKADKENLIYFDEISQNILNNISGNNLEYVKAQLEELDDNFNKYMDYLFEKYYRNGFCDGVQLIDGCLEK